MVSLSISLAVSQSVLCTVINPYQCLVASVMYMKPLGSRETCNKLLFQFIVHSQH